MKRPAVTRARIVRLFEKGLSVTRIAKLVKRNYSVVRYHLIKASVLAGKIY